MDGLVNCFYPRKSFYQIVRAQMRMYNLVKATSIYSLCIRLFFSLHPYANTYL
jgi:hypothetical protein